MSKLLDSTRLEHMLAAAQRINRRLTGCSRAEFLAEEDLQDIALRQFMIIGEAAAHVSDATRTLFPQVDWIGVRGLRNYVAHEYFRVELPNVWDTTVNDVPLLLAELPAIIRQVQAAEQAQQNSSV